MTAPAAWLRPALLAFAGIAALLLLVSAPAIAALRFPDPDDVLRLVQVRDLLAGQGWFDLTQHRLDSPGGGVPMHWSRLVDVPLAGLILILTPLLGQPIAETVTAVAVPLLALACSLLLVGRLAHRVCGAEVTAFACLALALSVPALAHLLPLRIDHHGWQIALALAALSGVWSHDARRGGWVAGLSLAAWLAISLEGLPMAAATCGVLALRWLRDPADRAWFVNAMLGLAGGSAALFLATRGLAYLSNYCDAISPVHLAVFAWIALSTLGLSFNKPSTKLVLFGALGAIAAGGLAILLTVAPQCAGGSFAGMDPLVEQFWYRGIAEGQPIWQQHPGVALQALAPSLVGLLGTYSLWRGAADRTERCRWLDHALLLGAALAVTLFVTRAGAVAGALAAVPLGWQLKRWLARLSTAGTPVKAALLLGALAIVLIMVVPRPTPSVAPGSSAPQRASACDVAGAAGVLAALPRGEILAPMDIGPQLLLNSRHTIVASAHHRGEAGMRFAIERLLGSPEAASAALAERGTAYLALCPGSNELARFTAAAPEGLAAQLNRGEKFDWLEPVPVPPGSNLRVWRVWR